jgi:hypothetical protein
MEKNFMNLENALDKIHASVVQNTWLQLFTVFTRVILAVGFIPPSIKKILHQPFTVLPDSNPVGHYFNALYHTGFYYEFLGWGQIIAAILLLFPRTAHIGAMMFFPIILNIAVLTSSVGFVGTNYLTALMLLASTYLVCWEYDRLKPFIFFGREGKSQFMKLEFLWLPGLFALGGAAVASFLAYSEVSNIQRRFVTVLLLMTAGGFVFGLVCAAHHKFMKVGALEKPLL